MSLAWIAVNLLTGAVVDDLPDLTMTSVLKHTIGRSETATATLPVGNLNGAVPGDWVAATQPGGSVCIAVDQDTNIPLWGGIVTSRTRNDDDTVNLSLATAEWYMGARYVGTVAYSEDQNLIVADLFNQFIVNGAHGKPGLPLRVNVVNTGASIPAQWFDYSDVTVASAVSSLMGQLNGPEFTIEWEWAADMQHITPVVNIGSPLGAQPSVGLGPAATFELPGPLTTVNLVEDFSSGKGANNIEATSGQGIDRLTSGFQLAADFQGRPTFEYRYQPQSSTLVSLSLAQYAQQARSVMQNGALTLTFSAVLSDAPRLGVDWLVGDTAGYSIGGLDQFGNDIFAAFPGGLTGTARVIGWQITDDETPIITPTLYVPDVFAGASGVTIT